MHGVQFLKCHHEKAGINIFMDGCHALGSLLKSSPKFSQENGQPDFTAPKTIVVMEFLKQ